jgi:outer membrane immunogenic protein
MRKSLLLGAAYVALATAPAFAADLPARGPVKAPAMLPPVFSWTGCYVGVHVGGAFVADSDADTAGVIGGAQLGCNYQFAPNFVLGIEGDFSGSSLKDDASVAAAGVGTATASLKTDWFASVTGRLGYSVDQLLFYGKGGVAFAHTKFDLNGVALGVPFSASADETFTGWTVGAGIEWAFAPNWSTKIEYDYYDFRDQDFTVTGVAAGLAGAATGTVDAKFHLIKAGVNYRF